MVISELKHHVKIACECNVMNPENHILNIVAFVQHVSQVR